jgi:MFS family permease
MVLFELSVISLSIIFLLILKKLDKDILRKFGIVFIAVLLFEYFTQALWLNVNLERWAYLYLDVSWIITLGWATIIVVSMAIINLYFPRYSERSRFLLYLIIITIIGLVAEAVVVNLGIRQYSSAVKDVLIGYNILGGVPIEVLYYIPVFMALVLSFSRYWEISFGEPDKSTSTKKEGSRVNKLAKKKTAKRRTKK